MPGGNGSLVSGRKRFLRVLAGTRSGGDWCWRGLVLAGLGLARPAISSGHSRT